MTDGVQITGIDLHGYFVKDLERARAFYTDVIGLRNVNGQAVRIRVARRIDVWSL